MSQKKVHLCLVSAELSPAPPGSGNKPGELGACLQAELETEMQVSRQAEREGVPLSLCYFAFHRCVAGPDALALKDQSVGQPASLWVALRSSWERLPLEAAALGLSPMPRAAWALAGKDSSSRRPYGELVCAGTASSVAFSGGTSLPATLILPAALWLAGWGGGGRGQGLMHQLGSWLKGEKQKSRNEKETGMCVHTPQQKGQDS